MPKSAKRHYEAVAAVMASCRERPTWADIVLEFARRFAQDNPRFNRSKFLKACDYDEEAL